MWKLIISRFFIDLFHLNFVSIFVVFFVCSFSISKLTLIKKTQIFDFQLKNYIENRDVNDNFFTNDVRKTIHFIIVNYFRSSKLNSFFNRLFEKSNSFHDIKHRTISVKSIYIFNWIVNNIKFRLNVRRFAIDIKHLLNFVNKSIDITSRVSLNKSFDNSHLKISRSNRWQNLTSKKINRNRKLFESLKSKFTTKSNIFRRFNNTFVTIVKKIIYKHSIDLDLLKNISFSKNTDMFKQSFSFNAYI